MFKLACRELANLPRQVVMRHISTRKNRTRMTTPSRWTETTSVAPPEAQHFVLNQTMLRIKDPAQSLPFYCDVLGMTLLRQLDFAAMRFSLFFLGYARSFDGPVPDAPEARTAFTFRQCGLIELTHNWGTETEPGLAYHDGNSDPRGFGHIGVSVPDVAAACARFDAMGVNFVKRPDEGLMKGLAFIRDPDGYWIEILEAESLAALSAAAVVRG